MFHLPYNDNSYYPMELFFLFLALVSVFYFWWNQTLLTLSLLRLRLFWTCFVLIYCFKQVPEPVTKLIPWLDLNQYGFIQTLSYLNDFILLGAVYCAFFRQMHPGNWVCKLSYFGILLSGLHFFILDKWNEFNTIVHYCDLVFCILLSIISLSFVFRSHIRFPLCQDPAFLIQLGILLPSLLALGIALLPMQMHTSLAMILSSFHITLAGITLICKIFFFTLAYRYAGVAWFYEHAIQNAHLNHYGDNIHLIPKATETEKGWMNSLDIFLIKD